MLVRRAVVLAGPGVLFCSPSFLVRYVIVLSASTKSDLALVSARVSEACVVVIIETATRSWAVKVAKQAIVSAVS